MGFGDRLRELREDCQLTQQQCADRCGVAASQWSRWETDQEPGLRGVRKIADGLHLADDVVGYLVTGSEPASPLWYSHDAREAITRARDELSRLIDGPPNKGAA